MKITLPAITNGQDLTNINNNLSKIATALNENVLYRVNIPGEDNSIGNDIDFNGYKAYNLTDVIVNGVSISTVAINAATAAQAAEASALAASGSATAASGSATAAASSAASIGSALALKLNIADAISTYLSIANASSTYLTIATASSTYLSTATASTTYQTQAATTTALALKANLAGPTFTGVVTLPTGAVAITQTAGNNTTALATTAFVTAGLSFKANLVGDTTGGNAVAGQLGEYLTSTTSGTSATSTVALNAASISLTAGDWDVTGIVGFNAAASTTVSFLHYGLSTTTGTIGAFPTDGTDYPNAASTSETNRKSAPIQRFNLSATTTVFLVAAATFGTSTLTIDGFIRARRVR